ncbi:MAG TPA: hypothetical protein PLP33_25230 [Leptospiraceae bacterium]|nr:hypothetical protein [Leptospiraceae bacterium]
MEIESSPYCYCLDTEVPEGLSLDELVAWANSDDNINHDPIIGYEDVKAPDFYGGHVSSWAIRRCLTCGKIYSDHQGWA